MDPYQLYYSVVPGITPFEDPNMLPSTLVVFGGVLKVKRETSDHQQRQRHQCLEHNYL